MKYWLSFIFFISFYFFNFAHQNQCLNDTSEYIYASEKLIIKDIILIGNKQTVDRIIFRELDFFKNDTVSVGNLPKIIEQNKNKIFNTKLFIDVTISFVPSKKDDSCIVVINLKERWYIFPAPILELADRNFNEWWQEQDRDYSRLEYGLRFTHENFRGRKEGLRLVFQRGFTKKYELFYTIPYVNKKQTTGLRFSFSYSENNQIAFQSNQHKLDYYKSDDKVLRKRFYAGVLVSKRNKFYGNHQLELKYLQNSVNDSIAILNEDFFKNGRTLQKYFRLYYSYAYDRRDVNVYPLKGYYVGAEVEKIGMGIFNHVDMTTLEVQYAKFFELKYKFYTAHSIQTKLTTPSNHPYFNVQGLGYGQKLVRGYELNVIDGQHYILNRNEFKKHLFSRKHNLEKVIKISQLNVVPYSLYFKLHTDIGYVINNAENPLNNTLTNRVLLGYGAGFDLFSFYDMVIRFEYSFNNIQQHGFFMEFKAGI